jgi:hypothetical protein
MSRITWRIRVEHQLSGHIAADIAAQATTAIT